ncbi:MAG: MATE family efflux transporter [Bacteroidetes bacterium]|nr:MATE family efflux transporter [Bacteroidota bacterium]
MKLSVSNKDIIRLAAPISLSLLIPQINFLTNTAFLGKLGERELAINGITGIFYLIISMIGAGLASGVQVQMSRRAGEGDIHELTNTFTNGMMLGVAGSLLLMLLSLWTAPLIFGYSLHNSEHVLLSVNFLYIRVWGLPFLMLTQLVNAFYISTGRSKYLIVGSLASTATNILFDYLLIFGKGGFPAMGLTGAAIASIIAEIVYCVTMYGLFYIKQLHRIYPVFSYYHFDAELSARSLKVSSPLIVQYLFSIGGWQIFFIFVEHLGQKELAASQILRSVFGIVGIGTWAFANTCNTMVSNVIGQGKQREVIPVIWKISKLSLLFALCVCIPLVVFPDVFLSFYRDEPSIVALAIPSLRIIASATLLMAVSTVMFNGVVGSGNTLTNLFIEITCVGTYLVYCYVVIERNRMPLEWAWGSEFVYWTSLFVISYIYLRSGKWKGKVI